LELFGFHAGSFERIGPAEVQGILNDLAGSETNIEREQSIAVEARLQSCGRLTVEPGGQIEFSSAPRSTLAKIEQDLKSYLAELCESASSREIVFIAAGFDPLRRIDEQRWYPKQRYEVMRPYLASRGARAWDMMSRTCAIQVSVDFDSEEDLARKFIVGNRLAPVVTAMFANSPFENGRPSGYKSTRAAAWLQTDPDRIGISPPALGSKFSIEQFVDYALQVPMLFVRRDGRYVGNVSGHRFGDFLSEGEAGIEPIFQDWTDHLTTIFTEARLKQYIELRSIDCGSTEMVLAANALWKGLLYDAQTLDEAFRLAPELKREEWFELQESVARDALDAQAAGVKIGDLARELVNLASEGLKRIAPDEVCYLDCLRQLVCDDGICPADVLLNNWHGRWNQSIALLFDHLRIA
jgi:glutamate--cysteine ligase